MKRWYNPQTDDTVVLNDDGNFVRVAGVQDHDLPWFNEAMKIKLDEQALRVRCLELAVSAAKTGASYGQPVVQVAEAYRLFSLGDTPPSDPFAGLSFEQRLQALVEEFLNAEIEDARKIKHSMGEVFNRLDNAYPDLEEDRILPDDEVNAPLVDKFAESLTDSIFMQHKDIRA